MDAFSFMGSYGPCSRNILRKNTAILLATFICGTIQDVVNSLISTLEWIGDESAKIISFQTDA